jgi:hypothetical protein
MVVGNSSFRFEWRLSSKNLIVVLPEREAFVNRNPMTRASAPESPALFSEKMVQSSHWNVFLSPPGGFDGCSYCETQAVFSHDQSG